MKMIDKMISKITYVTANKAAGNASGWAIYQPKEPITLKKIVKK